MVDVARNFQTKDSILKLIDVMSVYKLNKLHLHLSDDEGWRLEIPGLPELTQVGIKKVVCPYIVVLRFSTHPIGPSGKLLSLIVALPRYLFDVFLKLSVPVQYFRNGDGAL